MKKIKILFLITFFFSLLSENIKAEKSNKIGTNKVISDEVSEQLKELMDLYKEGVFSASMAAKLKKVKDDNPKG